MKTTNKKNVKKQATKKSAAKKTSKKATSKKVAKKSISMCGKIIIDCIIDDSNLIPKITVEGLSAEVVCDVLTQIALHINADLLSKK